MQCSHKSRAGLMIRLRDCTLLTVSHASIESMMLLIHSALDALATLECCKIPGMQACLQFNLRGLMIMSPWNTKDDHAASCIALLINDLAKSSSVSSREVSVSGGYLTGYCHPHRGAVEVDHLGLLFWPGHAVTGKRTRLCTSLQPHAPDGLVRRNQHP